MTQLAGHEAPWRQWRAGTASERLHHAWLLTGARGLGKASFALAAAAEMVAQPGVPQPRADAHPDIMVLTRPPDRADDEKRKAEGKPYNTKRNIKIDQVRAMQARLTMRPTLGPRRAIILDSVDDLEKSAINALLKSLEEPPEGSIFLLVSHRPGGLMATVRSRCRLLRFRAVDDAEMHRILAAECPDADGETVEAAIAAAGGSPGAALAFLASDLAPVRRELVGLAEHGDPNFERRGRLARAIGNRPDSDRLLNAVRLARNICAERLAGAPVPAQRRLIVAHEALVRLGAEIRYANFDPGLTVVQIGSLLADAALPKEGAH